MDERDTKDMADMTRRLARKDGPMDGEKAGSHDFPSAVGPGGVPLGKQGTGQSDDVSGQAPASGMARQHANPAIRRDEDGEDTTGDERAEERD